jgi:SWI/SNF-related matrix-associated actin-dependent regulator 1 of chromatin subfamily A
MDALDEHLAPKKANKSDPFDYMRIDGQTKAEHRQENVKKFQNDKICRVALLSITAACLGLTLTAASTVVFAEVHWTPALMQQAEDRSHRIG